MSLFENESYEWRETYFILFREQDRPSAKLMKQALKSLGTRFEINDAKTDKDGNFESISVVAADDFSAIDVCFCAGEDVAAQIEELLEELSESSTGAKHQARMSQLAACTARLELYHFQQVMTEEDTDEFLDPGALLLVLKKLTKLCNGISIDPQSGIWN